MSSTDTQSNDFKSPPYTLHYLSAGDGDTLILLIHGMDRKMQNVEYWRPFYSKLSELGLVVGIDMLGHGSSEPGEISELSKRFTAEEQADVIFELVKSLFRSHPKLKKLSVIGRSFGGQVTIQLLSKIVLAHKDHHHDHEHKDSHHHHHHHHHTHDEKDKKEHHDDKQDKKDETEHHHHHHHHHHDKDQKDHEKEKSKHHEKDETDHHHHHHHHHHHSDDLSHRLGKMVLIAPGLSEFNWSNVPDKVKKLKYLAFWAEEDPVVPISVLSTIKKELTSVDSFILEKKHFTEANVQVEGGKYHVPELLLPHLFLEQVAHFLKD